MDIARSDIVKSAAGRDRGRLFFVLGTEGEFLLLADGKSRKLERPKRKKRKHVTFACRADGPQRLPGGRKDQKRREIYQ